MLLNELVREQRVQRRVRNPLHLKNDVLWFKRCPVKDKCVPSSPHKVDHSDKCQTPRLSDNCHLIALGMVVIILLKPSHVLISLQTSLVLSHLKNRCSTDSVYDKQSGHRWSMFLNPSLSLVSSRPLRACHVVNEYFGGTKSFHTNLCQSLLIL